MNMKYKMIVIGSNSFSGSDFIDLVLEKNQYNVIGISRSPEKSATFLPYKRHSGANFTFYQMDLNTDMASIIELIDSYQPDYIVNFAAQSEVAPSWENPEHWFQTNVVSLARLTNYLKDKNYLKKYVHISSPEVYGSCQGIVTEEAPLNPSTPYAASKAAADLFLFTLVKNYNFPLIMIRSTNVYGAYQQLFKIIPRTFIYLKKNIKIQLHGGGQAVKSYIHIRDISRGELMAMEKGTVGNIYHFSPEQGTSVCDIVKKICDIQGHKFTESVTNVEERLGQDAAYIIDSSKARRELDWKTEISIEQGLTEVMHWINENWDEIKQQPQNYMHKI